MQIEGKLWKDKLRAKIAEVAFYSKNFEDFLQRCTECGIEYVYKLQNKVKLKFRLSGEGQQKFTRADTLGENYTAEKIAEQIEQIQKAQAVLERLSEKKKPEKPVATAPVTTTKTKPTAEVSAPTTPPSESIHFIADTVLARMREKGITPPPPAPKPTQTVAPPKPVEVKAPEKKEDVWAGIRGMRDSAQVIADLEASGITSLSELRSFFWNIKHNDDHTAELTELEKKIKTVDKLIAMMKQRTDNSATYKEYQERSAFTQNRFRKKNAAAIDSYEEAVKYIKDFSFISISALADFMTAVRSFFRGLGCPQQAFVFSPVCSAKYNACNFCCAVAHISLPELFSLLRLSLHRQRIWSVSDCTYYATPLTVSLNHASA